MKQIKKMENKRLEKLMFSIMIAIVLLMGSGLVLCSCSTPKHFQVKELPSEFTNKCGDCRDLK